MKIYNTACPRNCYSTCSFKVHVDEDKIVKIDPQPANKATPEGVCIKGLSYVERAHSKDRILHPLKKNLETNSFEEISWEEAFETISNKLKTYKKEFGAQSVLFYTASGMSGLMNGISSSFWKLYGGATTCYGNLCWPAGLEATKLTLGENKHNVPWDLENAKLIVLWGKNPAETNIQETAFIDNAIEKGAKVIAIDPRRTASVEQADLFLQPKPGTDGALALGIANYLISTNKIDKEFISKNVLGFDAFTKHVSTYTLAKTEEITAIPADKIQKAADLIGDIQPMTIVPGYGMQRYTNGGQSTRCLLAIQVITGNIGKPGACWHYANLQSYVFDDVLEPDCYFPPKKPDGIFRRSISMAKLGEDMLVQKDPDLKMIWVERGNPLTQNPDTNKLLKAFKNLEFRVVVDQFMTDTALEADIILPAKNMFEQSDIIGSYWNPYVQLKQKVVEPAGEVKPESEIYYLLAKKLGYSQDEILKYIPEPGDKATENYLKGFLSKFPELSWDKLKEEPQLAPGLEHIAFENLKFNTPSGKIELYSEQAKRDWGVEELPDYVPLIEGDDNSKYPIHLISPNTKNRIHSQFGNLNYIKQFAEEPELEINYKDAKERGIKNGALLRMYNDRGEIKVVAKYSFSIKKGCVSIPNGWWKTEGGGANILSKGRETDMGHGSAFHDNRVEIEKA